MAGGLEIIWWIDATAEIGWESGEPEVPDMRCMSVGWVLAEDERAVCLAATIGEDSDEHNSRIWIPVAWITRREPLVASPGLGPE